MRKNTTAPIRIYGLKNVFNSTESELDVEVYSDDLHDFIVITEPENNPGASVTNGIESFAGVISSQLGLQWNRCVFIESYPSNLQLNQYDPTFDLIKFDGEPRLRVSPVAGASIPFARLAQPGWSRLPLELAQALQAAGCQMTLFIGKKLAFHDPNPKTRRNGVYQVMGYDGRCYYTEGGVFLSHHIRDTNPRLTHKEESVNSSI